MTAVLDKLEQMASIAERLEGLIGKLPRFAEMLGVSLFAGRASENVGGRFIDGAMAGVVADGLAHSNLPNNQVGGVALGAYLGGVGLLNVLPPALWEEAPAIIEPDAPPESTESYEPTWLDWWGNFLFPPRPVSWDQ